MPFQVQGSNHCGLTRQGDVLCWHTDYVNAKFPLRAHRVPGISKARALHGEVWRAFALLEDE